MFAWILTTKSLFYHRDRHHDKAFTFLDKRRFLYLLRTIELMLNTIVIRKLNKSQAIRAKLENRQQLSFHHFKTHNFS